MKARRVEPKYVLTLSEEEANVLRTLVNAVALSKGQAFSKVDRVVTDMAIVLEAAMESPNIAYGVFFEDSGVKTKPIRCKA